MKSVDRFELARTLSRALSPALSRLLPSRMRRGVFAEPQRPGKAIYATGSGTDGVLIGWTPPPTIPSPGSQPTG